MKKILLMMLLITLLGCKKKAEQPKPEQVREAAAPSSQVQLPLLGMHTNHMPSWPVQIPFDCWRNLSATGSGSANDWNGIQTSATTYDFQLIDDAMTKIAAQGKTCVVYTPEWTPEFIAASSGWSHDGTKPRTCACGGENKPRPNQCYPPKDLNGDGTGTNQTWKDFITNLAGHVHSRHQADPAHYADITFYTDGNEYADNGPQWCGSFPQLARMMSDEKCIIQGQGPDCMTKGINPAAKVMTISIFNDQNAKDYLVAKAPNGQTPAEMADMIDTHNDYVLPNNPEQAVPALLAMRKLVDGVPASQGKPIFNTEGGWCCNQSPSSWVRAATFISRFMLAMSSTGIYAHIFFGYDFNNGGTPAAPSPGCCTAFWDSVNTKGCTTSASPGAGYFCPTQPPYVMTMSWLKNITFNGPCSGTGGVWTCQHTSTGGAYGTGQFAWYSVMDGTTSYPVPAGYSQMEDINGKVTPLAQGQKITLTNSPVLLTMAGVLPTMPESFDLSVGVQ